MEQWAIVREGYYTVHYLTRGISEQQAHQSVISKNRKGNENGEQ